MNIWMCSKELVGVGLVVQVDSECVEPELSKFEKWVAAEIEHICI